MHILLGVSVILRVSDPSPRARELYFSSSQLLEVAHAVFMLELAVDDVGPDEEFGVRVGAKTGTTFHSVFIDHSKRSKLSVLRIVVRCEGEGVVGIEPAMVGVTSSVPWSFRDFEVRGAVGVAIRCRHRARGKSCGR